MWVSPANPIRWFQWYIHSSPTLAPLVESGVLSDEALEAALVSCIEIATYMLFCGYYKPACDALGIILQAQRQANLTISDRDKLMLETVWSTKPYLRFPNLPWQPFTAQDMAQGRLRMRTLASKPTPHRSPPRLGAYEDTEVPTLLDICRSYLDQPVDIDWPHNNAGEALEAMLKLHDRLPDYLPITHSFYLEVELSLCLGDINKTCQVISQILKRTHSERIAWHHSQDISLMGDCLCLDGFIDISSSLPAKVLNFSSKNASAISQTLISAINRRTAQGPEDPLRGVAWKPLLDRLAKAVSAARPVDWGAREGFLNTPATREDIQNAESALGMSLPQDFKEMVAVHNG